MLTYADDACRTPFEEFVGTDYQSSIWYITSVTPSEETWAEGDREIICTLDQQDSDGEGDRGHRDRGGHGRVWLLLRTRWVPVHRAATGFGAGRFAPWRN